MDRSSGDMGVLDRAARGSRVTRVDRAKIRVFDRSIEIDAITSR